MYVLFTNLIICYILFNYLLHFVFLFYLLCYAYDEMPPREFFVMLVQFVKQNVSL